MFVANKFGSLLDVYPKRAKFLSDILLLVGVAVCTTTHMIDLTMETHSIGLDWYCSRHIVGDEHSFGTVSVPATGVGCYHCQGRRWFGRRLDQGRHLPRVCHHT